MTTPPIEDLLRGALVLERTPHGVRPQRLPMWALDQAGDDRLAILARQTSGVRLAMRTAATAIELDVLATTVTVSTSTARPASPALRCPTCCTPTTPVTG